MAKFPFKRGDVLNVYGDIGVVLEATPNLIWIEFLFNTNRWASVQGRGYPFNLYYYDYKFIKIGEIDLPTSE